MRRDWKRRQPIPLQTKLSLLLHPNLPPCSIVPDEGGIVRCPKATALDSFTDVVAEVWARVTNQLRRAPATFMYTDKDTTSEDELMAPTRRKHRLKSGKVWTAETLVTRKITWPHEVIYTSQFQLALFVNGYHVVRVRRRT